GAASIDAVDTSVEMLAQLRAKADRLGWTTVHATDEPPAGAAGHDLVVCSSVLGFVPDHSATVAQLAGLLAPGGLFVQWDWAADPDPSDTADPHGLSRSAIETALVAADLVDVEVGVGFKLPFGDVVMRPLIGSGRALR
ncbi:MAG: methyltransferase, partial [Actinomycetota bacterium]